MTNYLRGNFRVQPWRPVQRQVDEEIAYRVDVEVEEFIQSRVSWQVKGLLYHQVGNVTVMQLTKSISQ